MTKNKQYYYKMDKKQQNKTQCKQLLDETKENDTASKENRVRHTYLHEVPHIFICGVTSISGLHGTVLRELATAKSLFQLAGSDHQVCLRNNLAYGHHTRCRLLRVARLLKAKGHEFATKLSKCFVF